MIGLIIKCVNYFQIRQSFDYSRPRGNQVFRPDVTPAAVHEFRHQSCYLYHNERSVSYTNRMLEYFVIDERNTELWTIDNLSVINARFDDINFKIWLILS